MNQKLRFQKSQLQSALNYATMIEDCDHNISIGRHTNYFKTVRQEAIEKYIEVMAEIVESATEVEFNKVDSLPFDQRLMNEINNITNDYKAANGL